MLKCVHCGREVEEAEVIEGRVGFAGAQMWAAISGAKFGTDDDGRLRVELPDAPPIRYPVACARCRGKEHDAGRATTPGS